MDNQHSILNHWLSGASFEGESTRTSPVYNPAHGTVQKEVRLATVGDVDTAVAAAKAAFPQWAETSLAKRQAIIFRFRELLNERREDLAHILTAEHGKVLSDAMGEIARGLEVVEFAAGIPHLMKGEYSENVSTGVDVYTTREPLGVAAIISPFNFPAMVPLWFFPIAIAAGNAVVLKPSEKDPSAANWMAELFTEAGLHNIEETSVEVSVEHATFEDWWEPFELGVGPAGAYTARLVPEQRVALRERCRKLIPAAPFTLTARAWAARGVV